jgi:cobyrinic acid a,c-diamide synthase
MKKRKYPRIIVAGLGGDSGKTFISCGILAGLKLRGLKPASFKKGPDYIDPAWLRLASGSLTRNLDTYMMDNEAILKSFKKNASLNDISVIEGNRGLHDGFDISGSHSTAELAKLLKAPVVLIINTTKVTRTAAAITLGCKLLDQDVNIAGIILNMVAGRRHQDIITGSIEYYTGIPVIGAIPKLADPERLPSRHLGLVTPREYQFAKDAVDEAAGIIKKFVSLNKIIEISGEAPELEESQENSFFGHNDKKVKIGYFEDRAFSFYYPENLEALEESGAELVSISSIDDKYLPDIDCLYIGGGFPETNVEALTGNKGMMQSVKEAVEMGLPIYAECGGLMYLARTVETGGRKYDMSNVLPIDIEMEKKPQGHGYMEVEIDSINPYYPIGTVLKGHEFHYSGISNYNGNTGFCMKVIRGIGMSGGKDGIIYKNVLACYLHLHTLSCKLWAEGMIKNASDYKKNRLQNHL